MIFYLHDKLLPFFNDEQHLFDQIMQLQGQVFRAQPGRKTQCIRIGQEQFFLKKHTGIGFKEIIKNLLQAKLPVLGAKNEWLAIQRLQTLNIPTPRVLGFGQRGKNISSLQSFVLLEALLPTISLEDVIQTWHKQAPTFKMKQAIIKQVAHIARTLHQNGINHRDFYLCHFLLSENYQQEQSPTLFLIDLHRAQIRKRVPLRWIIKDLAGLYFSSKNSILTQKDYFRFMKLYSDKGLRDCLSQNKQWWQQIKARGDQLYRDHYE